MQVRDHGGEVFLRISPFFPSRMAANIYAHVMPEADERNTDILADVFLKNV